MLSALSEDAAAHGNHPFGSLLVYDGQVILEAENTATRTGDPTQHAEINLIREALRRLQLGTGGDF